MLINRVAISLFVVVLSFANAELSKIQVLKGSVNCLDCTHGFDLSGIQVLVKCDKVKKLAMAYTEEDGTFNTELPSDSEETKPTNYPSNCVAKIMGGPHQLYTSTKDSLIQISKANKVDHFMTTSKPLNFYKSCPLEGKCVAKDIKFGSSKTVNLPVPREWGLPPTSYYIPYVPIIGIP
ncbi:hypothetical protein BUALT_Bualt13G0057400 [Buddleja alternifolia]|uniref:Pollen Ole e 1 allergen and extensin family protein n=1 Tax=Buddleja alternifolia TaxID=168488 RepID=A0AAV6WJ76_9LAMI|nr:hypothetical protein BUALT_Bualt13G0057400 [Buddleja alternifolia]